MGQGCWRIARSALSGSCVFVALVVGVVVVVVAVVAFGLSATFNSASVCVLAFLIPRTTYYKVDATPTLQLQHGESRRDSPAKSFGRLQIIV